LTEAADAVASRVVGKGEFIKGHWRRQVRHVVLFGAAAPVVAADADAAAAASAAAAGATDAG